MTLVLTKRIPNGTPLTAVQNDANMTAIESAVNTNTSNITTLTTNSVTNTALNAYFEGVSAGKQQVDWARLTNKPAWLTQVYAFNAYASGSDQTISATGTVNVALASEAFDSGGAFASSTFTVPVSGYYQFNGSVQVQLSSGSPTNVAIIANLLVNGSGVDNATLDNSGTGTRIYKMSNVRKLAIGDTVKLSVDFSFTGSATWAVAANSNTCLNGFLIQPY